MPYLLIALSNILGGSTYAVSTEALKGFSEKDLILWRMALCGLGFGFFQSPNNRAMVSSSPRSRSGAAGGMLATARVLGQTIGAVSVFRSSGLLRVRVATPSRTSVSTSDISRSCHPDVRFPASPGRGTTSAR